MIGRIQFGAVPGLSAQVTVPACCAPAAGGGIVPNPPPRLVGGVAFEALPQPASAVTPATASAATTVAGRANLFIAPASRPVETGLSARQPGLLARPLGRSVAGQRCGRSAKLSQIAIAPGGRRLARPARSAW